MSLIKCPECKKKRSNQAEVCPHCGSPYIASPQKTSHWGTVIVFLLLFSMLSCITLLPEREYTEGSDDVGAVVACQHFVKNALKSPATAKFDFSVSDDVLKYLGNEIYQVDSYVDSQNGFGAMMRSNFTCKVKRNEDGTFQYRNVAFK